MGAGLDSVVGLLVDPTYFFFGTGGGAGLGLVVGAIIEQSRERRHSAAGDGEPL